MNSTGTQIYVAKLAGTPVFDPLGDQVGRVRDVVVLLRLTRAPRVVGLVVEVPGKRRVFLPMTRVTTIDSGQVISTGLLNMRRFEQRATETLILGELLDRNVTLKDGSGNALIEDVAIERTRTGDWNITRVFVRRTDGRTTGLLRRRGETLIVDIDAVQGLEYTTAEQGAASLLAAHADKKPADLADLLHELGDVRRVEVATALDDPRLADVLEELPEDDQVAILSALPTERAANVLELMQPDDAADLLHELPDDQAAQLLEAMEPEEARDVRRLLAYDENTAGGMMTTDPVILAPETPIAQALAHIRRQDLPPALASTVFVVRPPLETPTGRFLGVAHFQRLLREPPHSPIGAILDTDIEHVTTDARLGHVARLFAAYNALALPVLDSERRLLGVVSVDDILDHMLPDDWREQPHTSLADMRDEKEGTPHG
ncbi:magnesium transporter MgtE N-terminal domain-containing protein [Jonesia denitrificans]|uniref:MgtE intracellular region n=1 Tax=Jonesia denitrificans (strain ATCC 14870 / DSM 20603 / BCRC 15368 / CIP 55.134 / JCM 11481 / NBRC 15587 / NCTC 10816 / Prevot 55134) TaxID=471856 RepID=C7R1P7_JONDD|nr:CBS domain-containing protein [Jonesia denitrificans]ACV08365.1 MgtE intracellular region [Jonesia denitrificans DSM 20603]ASE07978.1 CBS domain-containing protein [Jonesia denitrificans]QXB42586.1 CBS domain-containing protein [Jonesia denitrificans]SQH20344.1 Magnesium transporter mgtE [Jonesia denitrificans]